MGKYSDFAKDLMDGISEAGKGAGGFFGQDLTSARDLEMAQIQADLQARLAEAETQRLSDAYNAGSGQRIPNTTTGPRIQRLPSPYDQPTLDRARTRAGSSSSTGGMLALLGLLGVVGVAASRSR